MSALPNNFHSYAGRIPQQRNPHQARNQHEQPWQHEQPRQNEPSRGQPLRGMYQAYEPSDAERRLWQDWAALVLGLGIAASPWLLGLSALAGPTMNALIVGLLVSALAALSLTLLDRWEAWINLGLAFWLCLSPWLLGYGYFPLPSWGHSLMGLGLAVLAISAILRGLREAP